MWRERGKINIRCGSSECTGQRGEQEYPHDWVDPWENKYCSIGQRIVNHHIVLLHNLLQFVGQVVNLVACQLGEVPPIIVHLYTLHQVIDVLALQHLTTTSTWAIGTSAKIEVTHIALNLRWVLLYILTITQPHSWYRILPIPHIHHHLRFGVLLQHIPQHLCIFLNTIQLRLQKPLRHKEHSRRHNSMLLPPFRILCSVLWVWCFLFIIENAENLFLLQEYLDFQSPALVVHTITILHSDHHQFGHLVICTHIQSVSTPLTMCWRCRNSSSVSYIREVPGLISSCVMSIVLNLFNALNWLAVSVRLTCTKELKCMRLCLAQLQTNLPDDCTQIHPHTSHLPHHNNHEQRRSQTLES